ncbi:TetR/AcrR family transcriptional regulator [Dysgonomonas macrotermitis]|uniref:Transcriptional regulator, TetR family n=1 Tax=Dysgonomonas macrotermitis TaxID=1346286 RepID=A0A1M5DRF9_9BACT|nr:TetR family transcriptional regulator [Dysgonomonas macrotermitis]SHF69506.1 transcriptional regulator, TetR family [Dysgonomonas macrotermitis]
MFNTEDSHIVKEKILKEAQDLFIRNGYRGTSVRDIAKASGTNVAMVNYYFRSKYNLFEIIFEEAMDVLTSRILETINSDLPFFELIETWIHTYYEILFEYPQIAAFILNEVSLNPEALTQRIKNKNPFSSFSKIEARIHEEVKKGVIKETPAADFLLNILSLCMFPFLFGNMAMTLLEIPRNTYDSLIASHEKYVIQFVTNALKPNINNTENAQ